MSNDLEQIALKWKDSAALVQAAVCMAEEVVRCGQAELVGDATALIEQAKANFAEINELFWKRFKYPLQVFDLKKGEKPEYGRKVFAYHEKDKLWYWVYCHHSGIFENERGLGYYLIDEMHRWTRLPVLEDE